MKLKKKCEWCRVEFSYWDYRVRKFCSHECGYAHRRKDRIHKVCKECKIVFTKSPTSTVMRCKDCIEKGNKI